MYALLDHDGTRDMGLMDMVRDQPWPCRVVIHRQPNKGRKHRNLDGAPARTTSSRKVAARYREPWLIGSHIHETAPDNSHSTGLQ